MDTQLKTLSPESLEFSRSVSDLSFKARCVAPRIELGETGWSFTKLADETFQSYVSEECTAFGASTVYAPDVAHSSARIIPNRLLRTKYALPSNVQIMRNPQRPADGVQLEVQDAFAMSAAGCALLVACGGDHMVAAHCSRAGLVDEIRLVTGTMTRAHSSLLDAIGCDFLRHGIPTKDVRLYVLFSISPENFTHPLDHPNPSFAKRSKKLFRHIEDTWGKDIMWGTNGHLDIGALVAAQAAQKGFHSTEATCVLPSGTGFATTREPGLEKSRNLIMIVRER